ncbi:anti-sigma factor [Nocardioides sp. JQ2195]|uniref:anti-sigma factor n=1 Tax=Nocardioides sp. JQ2195 TaxID=2592334 RepID=UPI00143EB5D0|nr:anti-sigma factor [Nocardioides sp. JQ2195]QIX28314.1 anti-sigma factor [Nocardioides sp. JQ2195]
MSDIHALSGAYAVDALDEHERALFEQHLADCADCRAEVESLRETSALMAEITPVAPPPAMRDRLLAEIRTVRPLPPEVTPPTGGSGVTALAPRRRRRFPALLAAAAAVVAIGAGTTVALQPWDDEQTTQQLSAADQVIGADDAQEVGLDLPGGARAELVRSVSLGKAVLVTHDMPAAPDDKVYQLWLQSPEGAMVPAGLMPRGANQKVLLKGDAAEATAAGITVEPAGGSQAPTSDPIALFDLEQGA